MDIQARIRCLNAAILRITENNVQVVNGNTTVNVTVNQDEWEDYSILIHPQDEWEDYSVLIHPQALNSSGLTKEQFDNLNHYKLKNENIECVICTEKVKKNALVTSLNCTHSFHKTCIKKWLKASTKCPLCRQDQCSN